MKIAVASQNRKAVTAHAGKCRRFWIYEIQDGEVTGRDLLELTKDQSFHEAPPYMSHPLDEVSVLICGGMGEGLKHRLGVKGIEAVVTQETDPDKVVADYFLAS